MPKRFLILISVLSSLLLSNVAVYATDIVLPLPIPVLTTYLPIAPTSIEEPRHSLPIGVQMFGATGADSTYFEVLKSSRANWVNVPIQWREVEPVNSTPESYRWAVADQAVAAAIDADVKVIITHQSNPAWVASAADGPIDVAPLAESAEYLAALVERYDGDGVDDAPGSPLVEHFELYSQLDYSLSDEGAIQWGEVGHRYGSFLQAVYPAMKEANPNAQIIFGGIGHQYQAEGQSILVDVLAKGYADYFDMVALHVHPSLDRHRTPVNGGIGLLQKATAVRNLMNIYGLPKPLIVTKAWLEAGDLPDNQRDKYQQVQVNYMVQVMVQSIACGMETTIWHKLYDAVGNSQESGLVTPQVDGTLVEKPLMKAFQTLTRQLGEAKYTGMIPPQPDAKAPTEMHIFEVEDHRVFVAWVNPLGAPYSQTVSIEGSHAKVFDIFGEVVQEVTAEDDDYIRQIEISGEPRYIHVWK